MKKIFILLIISSLSSCNLHSPQEKGIRDNINKKVKLEMFDKVKYQNNEIPFDDFRKKYKYICLVYLQDGCIPCYPKYISWQKEMSSVNKFDFVTVLFIIKGKSYNDFIEKAQEEDLIEEDKYYTFMDPNNTFINGNIDIPGWIVERTLLINDKNQIKLIGSPFSTPEMTQVFYKICSN